MQQVQAQVVQQFAEANYLITPEAVARIMTHEAPEELIKLTLKTLSPDVLVVCPEHLCVQKEAKKQVAGQGTPEKVTGAVHDIRVLFDVPEKTSGIGDYEEFVSYFRDRYARLSEMLRKRMSARPIESLRKVDGREVSVIGIVAEKRTTANGHLLVEIEDTTGTVSVLVLKDKELFGEAGKIILDEVIGVTGSLSKDKRAIYANSIISPDMPAPQNQVRLAGRDGAGKAVLISDTHVGSKTFLEGAWNRFVEWMSGDSGDERQRELASQVRYVVVAGDVVDGIGIFPGQENELLISDVYEQYEAAAGYFNALPAHVKLVIAPGNHDAVRQAEPQPRLPERITKSFKNAVFVSNPSIVELDGTGILIYHGRSIDDLVSNVPGISYSDPAKAMVEMLRRRHLSPIYGGRVMVAPERTDGFVINNPPDILHCGHVHTVGTTRYKGVLAVNSGTWQSQTEFQKRMNLTPVPARAHVVDLKNLSTQVLNFYS